MPPICRHFSRIVFAVLAGTLLLVALPATGLVLPPEGIELRQIHVQFEWPPVGGAVSYDLQVVEDDASPDPFQGATPVVDENVGAGSPRAQVTSGLAFGTSYAWRVRGVDGSPLPWGATHRFDIAALPASFPQYVVTNFGGSVQPGLTLFVNRRGGQTHPMAVDQTGQVIWFLTWDTNVLDLRLLDNGRMLFISARSGYEVTLEGQISWRTPDPYVWELHHEISPLPDGNFISLVQEVQPVTVDSVTKNWVGDRAIVFDRNSNDELWTWSVFDHFSTLDFDQTNYDNSGSDFDWTHGNAAVYNPADDSIYMSFRHLSRITRVDYATGNIVYNMGFDMPSGDVDFGDNLFSFQHAPELQPDGNMLLLDNGNRRDHIVQTQATGESRAVELSFTGDPPTDASIEWSWTLPDYTGFGGDANRLANGNTLVSGTDYASIHEVDPSGSETWRLEIYAPPNSSIYRAVRIDSLLLDVPGDSDGDGFADSVDNCPDHANPNQRDCDGDGFGDLCSYELKVGNCVPPLPALSPLGLVLLCGTLVVGALASKRGPGPSLKRPFRDTPTL